MTSQLRNIIVEEGLDARNFVSWRVPRAISREVLDTPIRNVDRSFIATRRDDTHDTSMYRDPIPKSKIIMSAASNRLWKLIYQNVCRSVDELYQFCEEEQNSELCEQSFQFFLSSCRDFALLTQLLEKDHMNTSTIAHHHDKFWSEERENKNIERRREREQFLGRSPKRGNSTSNTTSNTTYEFIEVDHPKSVNHPISPEDVRITIQTPDNTTDLLMTNISKSKSNDVHINDDMNVHVEEDDIVMNQDVKMKQSIESSTTTTTTTTTNMSTTAPSTPDNSIDDDASSMNHISNNTLPVTSVNITPTIQITPLKSTTTTTTTTHTVSTQLRADAIPFFPTFTNINVHPDHKNPESKSLNLEPNKDNHDANRCNDNVHDNTLVPTLTSDVVIPTTCLVDNTTSTEIDLTPINGKNSDNVSLTADINTEIHGNTLKNNNTDNRDNDKNLHLKPNITPNTTHSAKTSKTKRKMSSSSNTTSANGNKDNGKASASASASTSAIKASTTCTNVKTSIISIKETLSSSLSQIDNTRNHTINSNTITDAPSTTVTIKSDKSSMKQIISGNPPSTTSAATTSSRYPPTTTAATITTNNTTNNNNNSNSYHHSSTTGSMMSASSTVSLDLDMMYVDLDFLEEEEVVKASEAVWAEAEAWIDAEAAVEEEAWQAILEQKTLEEVLAEKSVIPYPSTTFSTTSATTISATNTSNAVTVAAVTGKTNDAAASTSNKNQVSTSTTTTTTITTTSSSSKEKMSHLTVQPNADYIGIQLTTTSIPLEIPTCASSDSTSSSIAQQVVGEIKSSDNETHDQLSSFEPISPSIFLESKFLRDNLDDSVPPRRPSKTAMHTPVHNNSISSGSHHYNTNNTSLFSPTPTSMLHSSTIAGTQSFDASPMNDALKYKLLVAETNRDRNVEERKHKARIASHRVKVITEKTAIRLAKKEQALEDKLKDAQKRHAEYVQAIKGRAGNENAKVSEVMFINTLNEENLVHELQQRLEEVEARILAAANRRNERLQDITVQRKKRYHQKNKQMSDARLHLEQQRMERWEKLQLRLENVQKRREARLLEMSRGHTVESILNDSNTTIATVTNSTSSFTAGGGNNATKLCNDVHIPQSSSSNTQLGTEKSYLLSKKMSSNSLLEESTTESYSNLTTTTNKLTTVSGTMSKKNTRKLSHNTSTNSAVSSSTGTSTTTSASKSITPSKPGSRIMKKSHSSSSLIENIPPNSDKIIEENMKSTSNTAGMTSKKQVKKKGNKSQNDAKSITDKSKSDVIKVSEIQVNKPIEEMNVARSTETCTLDMRGMMNDTSMNNKDTMKSESMKGADLHITDSVSKDSISQREVKEKAFNVDETDNLDTNKSEDNDNDNDNDDEKDTVLTIPVIQTGDPIVSAPFVSTTTNISTTQILTKKKKSNKKKRNKKQKKGDTLSCCENDKMIDTCSVVNSGNKENISNDQHILEKSGRDDINTDHVTSDAVNIIDTNVSITTSVVPIIDKTSKNNTKDIQVLPSWETVLTEIYNEFYSQCTQDHLTTLKSSILAKYDTHTEENNDDKLTSSAESGVHVHDSLPKYLIYLQNLLLLQEDSVKSMHKNFSSDQYRATILKKTPWNDLDGCLYHLWSCCGTILNSIKYDDKFILDRCISNKLLYLLSTLLDDRYGLFSTIERYKYTLNHDNLLLSICICYRYCILHESIRHEIYCHHTKLVLSMIDLSKLLVSTLSRYHKTFDTILTCELSEYSDGTGAMSISQVKQVQQISLHMTICMQSLSLLWNTVHFIISYYVSDKKDKITVSSHTEVSNTNKSIMKNKDYTVNSGFDEVWNDFHSELVYYMFVTDTVYQCIHYLNTYSMSAVQTIWKYSDVLKTNKVEKDTNDDGIDQLSSSVFSVLYDASHSTLTWQFIEFTPQSSSASVTCNVSSNGTSNNVLHEIRWKYYQNMILGQYELLCGGTEFILSLIYYLRLSASIDSDTVITTYTQMKSRKHYHTKGRHMTTLLTSNYNLVSVYIHILSSLVRLNTVHSDYINCQDSTIHKGSISNVSYASTNRCLPVSDDISYLNKLLKAVWNPHHLSTDTTSKVYEPNDTITTLLSMCIEIIASICPLELNIYRQLNKANKNHLGIQLGVLYITYISLLRPHISNDSVSSKTVYIEESDQFNTTITIIENILIILGFIHLPNTNEIGTNDTIKLQEIRTDDTTRGQQSIPLISDSIPDDVIHTHIHGISIYKGVLECICYIWKTVVTHSRSALCQQSPSKTVKHIINSHHIYILLALISIPDLPYQLVDIFQSLPSIRCAYPVVNDDSSYEVLIHRLLNTYYWMTGVFPSLPPLSAEIVQSLNVQVHPTRDESNTGTCTTHTAGSMENMTYSSILQLTHRMPLEYWSTLHVHLVSMHTRHTYTNRESSDISQ